MPSKHRLFRKSDKQLILENDKTGQTQQNKQNTVMLELDYTVIGSDSLKITPKKNSADGDMHEILEIDHL